jgi:proteic killer suppression protein
LIQSFNDKETERIYNGEYSKKFPTEIQLRARRKLKSFDSATDINDFRVPPSNHLEKLEGDRKGQWSIRVNNKYRICFNWKNNHAEDVELVDYH